MGAIEAVYNLMLSMFICACFMLAFLSVLFIAQGLVYALGWLFAGPRATEEEFPGGDSCGDDALDWKNRQY